MLGASGVVGMCSVQGSLGTVPLGFIACRTARGLSHLFRGSMLLLFPQLILVLLLTSSRISSPPLCVDGVTVEGVMPLWTLALQVKAMAVLDLGSSNVRWFCFIGILELHSFGVVYINLGHF